MAYLAAQFGMPGQKTTRNWALSELAGGLNVEDLEYKLGDSQSPNCKNVWFNNRSLCKRWGTRSLNASALGSAILAMYPFKFAGKLIFACGTGLYSIDASLGTVTAIYSGLTANEGAFFKYNGKLYYINGAQYIVYDGTTAAPVAPYIPTVVINRMPSGTSPSLTNTFTGDGSKTYFQLSQINLTSAPLNVTVGGAAKTEIADYVVDRTKGVVTFYSAPASGAAVSIKFTVNGAGDPNEDYNRMGAGVRNSFNSDGAATVYTLTSQGLDAALTSCTINNVQRTEGVHYTVDRVGGLVNFAAGTSPNGAPAGGQNNVVITFYKTDQPTAAQFLQCTCAVSFGGQNDNRIFFAGNATSYYYWSDATRPEYIPISQYNLLGSNDDEITGFGLQNDTLVIFKSRSIYGVTYSWDDTTATAYFPCVNLNASIGCDCPGTIALINNRLTWLASYAGVFTLVNQTMTGTTAGVYRNVNPISRNINGNGSRSGLLQEANLTSAAAVDFGRKYWIAVNGHVWLWDYGMTPYSSGADLDAAQEALSWWYFDSLNIACFAQDGTDLYFGDTVSGYIVHFENSFADNGAAIDASWKMKINHLGLPNELKTVTKLWLSCRADTSTTLNINYYTDTQPDGVADAQPILISSFDLSQFDLSSFCLGVSNWFGEYLKKPPIKNCQAFSVEFTNGTPAQDLNVSDVIIAYIPVKEVKRSV